MRLIHTSSRPVMHRAWTRVRTSTECPAHVASRSMDQAWTSIIGVELYAANAAVSHCFRTASQHSIVFDSYLVAFLEDVGNVIAILQAPADRQNVVNPGPGN
jgi:hypothetical protein